MKKQFVLILALMITGITTINAQGGGFQRRTVEERVAAIHAKLDSAFKPDAAKLTQIDSVFANYYRSTDKVRQELMSGGQRPDMQVMREKNQPFADARDKELTALLGEANFKVWKETIEPSMQRRGGPGGGNRQQ